MKQSLPHYITGLYLSKMQQFAEIDSLFSSSHGFFELSCYFLIRTDYYLHSLGFTNEERVHIGNTLMLSLEKVFAGDDSLIQLPKTKSFGEVVNQRTEMYSKGFYKNSDLKENYQRLIDIIEFENTKKGKITIKIPVNPSLDLGDGDIDLDHILNTIGEINAYHQLLIQIDNNYYLSLKKTTSKSNKIWLKLVMILLIIVIIIFLVV